MPLPPIRSEAVERCALLTAEHQSQLLLVRNDAARQEAAHWQERTAALEQVRAHVVQHRVRQWSA